MLFARSALVLLVLVPAVAVGQAPDEAGSDWRFLTRATLSGNSHESSPAGYEIYSGLSVEGAIARDVTDLIALELALRTESREVEGPTSLPERRLGSLEVVVSTLTLKWQPRSGSGQLLQPFAGGGGTVTYVWEKSGLLDSSDPPIAVSPVIQLGSHLVFSHGFLLTLDVKWHPLDVELEGFADPAPKVNIDPLVMGAGFGFAF
jgi:outer membrane protein W